MNLSEKYKPLFINELEIDYTLIEKYLSKNETFIVNGSKNSGKSTILKLYLKILNYDYLLIDDVNTTKENIIEKIKYRTNSVFSYFYNKKYIIVIDNFDLFDISVKDYIIKNSNKLNYVIITNKYLNSKINYVRINNYSIDYLMNLYCIIYFLEKGINCSIIPEINNITQLFTLLEFFTVTDNLTDTDIKALKNYKLIFDKYEFTFNDLVKETKFNDKLKILNKLNSYNIYQYNLVYNYNDINDLADSYENLSSSLEFYNKNHLEIIEYYSIISIIGTSYNKNNYKIIKQNLQFRKKKNLKYY